MADAAPAGALDLEACDAEPIRVPGAIQPHGALLVADRTSGRAVQASANFADLTGAAWTGDPQPLDVLCPEIAALAREVPAEPPDGALRTVSVNGRAFHVTAHGHGPLTLMELEPVIPGAPTSFEGLYPEVRSLLRRLEAAADMRELCAVAARHVRRITGFDRVLIYAFDPDWNGEVLAEDGSGALPSYLGLHFPASDIPAQARELYLANRLRLIPDARYAPVPLSPPLNPMDGAPLDLSFVGLRSVSPVHLEYMRNMGTPASMSVSVLVEDRLWGLISCHHAEPRLPPPPVRIACDLIGQVLGLQLGARAHVEAAEARNRLKSQMTDLLAGMTRSPTFAEGLSANAEPWIRLCGAEGAALVSPTSVIMAGRTPSREEVEDIVAWLNSQPRQDVIAVDSLPAAMPGAERFRTEAAGLLAVSISELHPSYILWFRPELEQTVLWGGEPHKRVEPGSDRLHPRKSFERWKEVVRGRSRPWRTAEIETAREFRNAVLNIVLRSAEERAQLAEELQRSNKELEAFSYSVSHDLRAPFRHIVGYSELLQERAPDLDATSRHYLENIIDAALSAGRLVDDLLAFSQLGRVTLQKSRVDMDKLMAEVLKSLELDLKDRQIEWRIGKLAPAYGDGSLLRQVLFNLVSNAVKYSRDRRPAVIEVFAESNEREAVYAVRDNGVGFDMRYVDKLFGVFQRLHRVEEFEGAGIGLALSRRIVDRHGGRIWAEGRLGEGATFRFALPHLGRERSVG